MEEATTNEITTIDNEALSNLAENIFMQGSSETSVVINFLLLAGIALIAYFLTRMILSLLFRRLKHQNQSLVNTYIFDKNVLKNFSLIVPCAVFQIGLVLVPHANETLRLALYNICGALTIFFVARTIASLLDVLISILEKHTNTRMRSYKGFVQLLKIALFVIAAILIIAMLIDRSPVILISGLGAMSAVTMLVFKDTILSFVAGAQIASNDMLRVGDWIEMSQVGADGTVIDIALHTVKVQNFDRTIVTIPTWRLISESYKNWRGMYETNGRRIKRSLYIDINVIKFMTAEDLKHLSHVHLLQDYLRERLSEIEAYDKKMGQNAAMDLNPKRLTNIGTFRAYVLAYLRSRPDIRKDLSLMVRQLQPTSEGLPLEVYCFSNTTLTEIHENIQSDIFDHLYSIMPDFGLSAYQQATGRDIISAVASQNTEIEDPAPGDATQAS